LSGAGTYSTDNPVSALTASGMVSGATLTLGGFAWPRQVSTLDNVLISNFFAFRHPEENAGIRYKVNLISEMTSQFRKKIKKMLRKSDKSRLTHVKFCPFSCSKSLFPQLFAKLK
jgi:hypothetical protein